MRLQPLSVRIVRAALLCAAAWTAPLCAHGLNAEPVQGGAGLRLFYDGGTPMAGVTVKVYSPADYAKPFVRFVTDPEGTAMFRPNRAGTWIMVATDPTGHGIRQDINVDEALVASYTGSGAGTLNGVQKLVMALCVAWGLVGTGLYFIKRTTESDIERDTDSDKEGAV